MVSAEPFLPITLASKSRTSKLDEARPEALYKSTDCPDARKGDCEKEACKKLSEALSSLSK